MYWVKNLKTRVSGALLTCLNSIRGFPSRAGRTTSLGLYCGKKILAKIRKISESNRNVTLEYYKKKIQILVEDVSVDESRLYQEAAILSEKKDITEELVRFCSHIDLFENYIDSNENKGKKLNFILQEMSREINTIGSKTDLIEINHMVIDMKDELEKIREQVQNIV